MFDVITVGSATRDIFLDASFLKKKQDYLCLDCGYKFDIEKPFIQTGGGATNTAVSFSRLGIKTAILTKVGNDGPGYSVKKTLQDENVNTGFIQTDDKLGTAMSIVIWKEKDRTIFTYRGASENIKLKHFNKMKTKWLYITALRGNSIKMLKDLLVYAHKKGIKVAMNPGSKELEIKSLFKYVNILLLNKEESEILSKNFENIREIMMSINDLGPKTIAVTNGKENVFVFNNKKIYYAKPYDIKIKSTLGAGDAFCSGFVASIIKNQNVEDAVKLGLLNSSSVIQHKGAKTGLLHIKNINNYENRLNQKLIVHKEELDL
ncbi:carbohydrate kinase family protein [Candidatus Woesearchaeota archaeon]|nr:carbohydrate kinase family protein [Candidatus Woesearchaeota archaeon]